MRMSILIAVLLSAAPAAVSAQQSAAYKPTLAFGTVPAPACPAKFDFQPEKDGIYKVSGDVKAPRLKHFVPAELSAEAKTRGAFNPFRPDPSIVSFVVDAQGIPQDLCILKAAGYGLDAEAAKAVWQYRFQPATTAAGTPVAARVSIQVKFDMH